MRGGPLVFLKAAVESFTKALENVFLAFRLVRIRISSSSEEIGRSMSPTNKIACFHATPACRMPKRKCLRESRKCQNALFSLAGVPQMPKRSFFDLRESRKRQNALFSICGNPANAKTLFFRFAGTPQTPKRSFFDLREPRKRQKLLFSICGNPASAKNYFFHLREPRK